MAPAVEHFATQRLRIGTAPGSELLFAPTDGSGLMPCHAEIREEGGGGGFHLVDLGTPSGTFVGRDRISRHRLRSGDRITLGGPMGPEFRVEILNLPEHGSANPADQVDLQTAERIVAEAVLKAAQRDDKAASIVAARVKHATRRGARNNLLLSLGVLLAFGGLVAAGISTWRAQKAATQFGTEMGMDRPSAEVVSGTIPVRVTSGREIYDANRTAVYVIGYLSGKHIGGICTAFAVQPSLLVTNAHCVNALKLKGGTPIVTQNDSGGTIRHRILATQIHPGYKASRNNADSPDLGLLRVDGKMLKTVTIANDAELRALGPGDDVFVLGFPGRVMDPQSPSLTFLQGHIGRLTAMGEQAADSPTNRTLIQHDVVTRGGNSGSPIFNQYGHVIGVHSAHMDDEEEVRLNGQRTTVVDSSPYRIGMRIDLLKGVPTP